MSLMSFAYLIPPVHVHAQSSSDTRGPRDAQSHHQWSYNLGMYEVNLRHYSKKVALLHLKKIWIELIHWDLALFGLCRYIPLANSTALAV